MRHNIDSTKFNERQSIMLSPLKLSGKGLEIGPGDRPLAPKKNGFDVETIDSMNRKNLIAKFKYGPYPQENIEEAVEEIDFIWDGKSYAELTGHRNHYDYVISSNVIEHVPDVIGHLNQCGEVLKLGGMYSLAIPDKRYCVDVFRPVTSVGSAVSSHNNTNHSIGAILDFFSYHTLLEGRAAWPDEFFDSDAFSLSFSNQQRSDYLQQWNNGEYLDIHNWVFTVSSFRLLIKELYSLEYIDLVEVGEPKLGFNSAENYWEFYVLLKKDPYQNRKIEDIERISLLKGIQLELRDRFNSQCHKVKNLQ